ncbi:MAG: Mur ligase family protein, partial [Opitutaceae bacterium]
AGDAVRALPAAVVNIDEAEGARLAAELRSAGRTRVVTFGHRLPAEVSGVARESGATLLRWPGGELEIVSPLAGREHAENLLAAVATAWATGRDPRVVLARLRSFPGVLGRLERVETGRSFPVWIDSARTADELRRTLATVRAATAGRMIVALGCAVDGAAEAVARELADEVHTGPDRRKVLAAALAAARDGDAILAAGRGHEAYENLGDFRVPGDDRRLLRGLLADLNAGEGSS